MITGRKFGFRTATTSSEELINDNRPNTIVITSLHNQHARYAREALEGLVESGNVDVLIATVEVERAIARIAEGNFAAPGGPVHQGAVLPARGGRQGVAAPVVEEPAVGGRRRGDRGRGGERGRGDLGAGGVLEPGDPVPG